MRSHTLFHKLKCIPSDERRKLNDHSRTEGKSLMVVSAYRLPSVIIPMTNGASGAVLILGLNAIAEYAMP